MSWGGSSGATDYQYCIDTTNNNSCDGSWVDVGTNTSVVLSGLSYNTTYYWQVQAVNASGTTAADGGIWWSFTTRTGTPPAAFGKSNPANGATAQPASLALSWSSNSGATSYQYCIDTTNDSRCDGKWTNADNHTSVNLIGLSYGTTYYWQARARNAGGTTEADAGTWWSFTTEAPIPVANDDIGSATPITTVPFSTSENTTNATTASDDSTFVCAGTQGAASVWFSFVPTTDGILRANTKGSTYDTILAVWQGTRGSLSSVACNDNRGAGRTSAVTASLTGGTTYYLEVAGHTGGGGLLLSVSFEGAVPAAVKLLSPANGSQSSTPSQVLDWTDSSGATYYQLEVHKGSATGPVVISAQPTVSTYTTGNLDPARYFWRVQACNANGCSAWSATWSFVIKGQAAPARPNLLSPPNGSQSTTPSQVLDWTDSSGATYYQLEVHKGSATGPVVISAQPTVSTYTTGILDPARYFWKVQACNVNGCSAWSATWSFVIKGQAKPARPNLLSPANGSKVTGQATLDWSDSAGATNYQVQIRRNSSSGPLVASLNPTNSTVVTSGLTSGHWYYWRVQACNASGCGNWTGWWRFMVSK